MPQFSTPVAFLIFNRPDTTRQVFAAIRKVRPNRLLVVADGPRFDWPEEAELCRQTRAILDGVDWPCQIDTNFSSVNLGCMRRVSSGIDWVFENVEEAIILEDDCLPHPTFFPFCAELLERFRGDPRIAQINGSNFLFGTQKLLHSYGFSRYNQSWGWATWRRAWQLNDNAMREWPSFRDSKGLEETVFSRSELRYWTKVLDKVAAGEIDTWDCRWSLSCLRQQLLSIFPSVNLVSNIGFGPEATHTTEPMSNPLANIPREAMEFPLRHQERVEPNREADAYTSRLMYREPSIIRKISALMRGWT